MSADCQCSGARSTLYAEVEDHVPQLGLWVPSFKLCPHSSLRISSGPKDPRVVGMPPDKLLSLMEQDVRIALPLYRSVKTGRAPAQWLLLSASISSTASLMSWYVTNSFPSLLVVLHDLRAWIFSAEDAARILPVRRVRPRWRRTAPARRRIGKLLLNGPNGRPQRAQVAPSVTRPHRSRLSRAFNLSRLRFDPSETCSALLATLAWKQRRT